MVGVVSKRQLDPVDPGQELSVARGGGLDAKVPSIRVELFELGERSSSGEIAEAVVVAEARMLEPPTGVSPTLVSETLEHAPYLMGITVETIPPSPVVICLFG